jgi:hypothetical protein
MGGKTKTMWGGGDLKKRENKQKKETQNKK